MLRGNAEGGAQFVIGNAHPLAPSHGRGIFILSPFTGGNAALTPGCILAALSGLCTVREGDLQGFVLREGAPLFSALCARGGFLFSRVSRRRHAVSALHSSAFSGLTHCV